MQCIARTIKDFEKALHAIFPFLPFHSIPSPSFALSAPSIFPLSPNDLAKGPHLEAHSGRMAIQKRPFHRLILAGRHSTSG